MGRKSASAIVALNPGIAPNTMPRVTPKIMINKLLEHKLYLTPLAY